MMIIDKKTFKKALYLTTLIELLIFSTFIGPVLAGHIVNIQKESGVGWWCLAKNDVYYSDLTYEIYVDDSEVKAERGSVFPIISGTNSAWVRLDTDKAEAYMDAWFYNTFTFVSWSARAYAWTDPPRRGGYHYTY